MRIIYEQDHIPETGKFRNAVVQDIDKQYLYDSEGTYTLVATRGERGDSGPQGSTGPIGATGAGSTGAQGYTGATGPQIGRAHV